eukprot:gene7468-15283_t
MRQIFTLLTVLDIICSGQVEAKKPEVRIVVLTQASGPAVAAAVGLDSKFLITQWDKHLKEKLATDPSWPFNATLEVYDTKSDPSYTAKILKARYSNSSLPPVTVLYGPETVMLSAPIPLFSRAHNIPWVTAQFLHAVPRPTIYNTSFSVSPPNFYQNIELINAYLDHGVKTIAFVTNTFYAYNTATCPTTANYAIARGLQVVAQLTLTPTTPRSDIVEIVRQLRDEYKPDAIIWCDIYSGLAGFTEQFNPAPMFKELNYLPKALSLQDQIDAQAVDYLKKQGLFQYTTTGTFTWETMTGSDYTEGNTPYSSKFRQNVAITDIYEELNFGSTSTAPSSAQLIYPWYKQMTGGKVLPRLALYSSWVTFDVIEAALYRSAEVPENMNKQYLPASEVIRELRGMNINTPGGPVRFNEKGDNMADGSIVVQSLSINDPAVVVLPVAARKATFVYPMPTWDERVYNWDLLGQSEQHAALAIAVCCSIILLAIAITVTIYRAEPEIRMLHYLHIVIACLLGILICISMALVWQHDNTQLQCNAYMWVTYLPASFIVHLINIKAYRLSTFMRASATGRRPKPFTQMRVLKLTMMGLLLTIILLVIASSVDPPVATRVINDPYRPKLDEYTCNTGAITAGILYFLVCFHVLASIICVISVRNGMEDFRDGMVIKESFVLLYILVIIAFVMTKLGLPSKLSYLMRSAFLCIGITVFILRLLISRCVCHWIHPKIMAVIDRTFGGYVRLYLSTYSTSNHTANTNANESQNMKSNYLQNELLSYAQDDGPAYGKIVPQDDSLNMMLAVLKDKKRLKVLQEVAEKSLTTENLDFLLKVLAYEEECRKVLVQQSSTASDALLEKASQIYNFHVRQHSEEEVNVSAASRAAFEKRLKDWAPSVPLMNPEDAAKLLSNDIYKRSSIFDATFHEINIMTYQNLWSKFRTQETTNMAMGE